MMTRKEEIELRLARRIADGIEASVAGLENLASAIQELNALIALSKEAEAGEDHGRCEDDD